MAVMMLNRPELVAFWIGMGKIGGSTALLNTNLTGKALIHTVDVGTKDSSVRVLIVDDELETQIKPDIDTIKSMGIKIYFWGQLLEEKISKMSPKRLGKEARKGITERDVLMMIFTSGTTGLPKASKISQTRYYIGSLPFGTMCPMNETSRIYNCLPLYHSAGMMLGVGAALKYGVCMALRKKFSVRSFASDCIKYNCTHMQYIGELCRYLLSAAPSADDAKLKLEYAYGNGMRPDVWTPFQAK